MFLGDSIKGRKIVLQQNVWLKSVCISLIIKLKNPSQKLYLASKKTFLCNVSEVVIEKLANIFLNTLCFHFPDESEVKGNPFRMPPDNDIFLLRDKERQKKKQVREYSCSCSLPM